MVCGDQGRFANQENILSQHARFLLEREEAEKAIATIEGAGLENLGGDGTRERCFPERYRGDSFRICLPRLLPLKTLQNAEKVEFYRTL